MYRGYPEVFKAEFNLILEGLIVNWINSNRVYGNWVLSTVIAGVKNLDLKVLGYLCVWVAGQKGNHFNSIIPWLIISSRSKLKGISFNTENVRVKSWAMFHSKIVDDCFKAIGNRMGPTKANERCQMGLGYIMHKRIYWLNFYFSKKAGIARKYCEIEVSLSSLGCVCCEGTKKSQLVQALLVIVLRTDD